MWRENKKSYFKMICEKCSYEIEERNFTDIDRIEEHHLHPKFMNNPTGLGKKIDLCNHCHMKKLHLLILNIIKKHSNLLSNKNNSEQWIFKYHVLPIKQKECIEEVIKKTEEWLYS